MNVCCSIANMVAHQPEHTIYIHMKRHEKDKLLITKEKGYDFDCLCQKRPSFAGVKGSIGTIQ